MRILIAVAHADDETLGCFSALTSRQDEVSILHATNSTPKDPRYAATAGYSSYESYEAGRRAEMLAALDAAGVKPEQWRQLPFADQDAARNVPAIRDAVQSFRADRIYTHAYEGGHPDHDTLAFALHHLPNVWEFPLYHANAAGEFTSGTFLSGEASETILLTPEQSAHKRKVLDCFQSQQRVVTRFALGRELFRPMRAYDFSKPPHAGEIYYEIRKHGWLWPDWRKAVGDIPPS